MDPPIHPLPSQAAPDGDGGPRCPIVSHVAGDGRARERLDAESGLERVALSVRRGARSRSGTPDWRRACAPPDSAARGAQARRGAAGARAPRGERRAGGAADVRGRPASDGMRRATRQGRGPRTTGDSGPGRQGEEGPRHGVAGCGRWSTRAAPWVSQGPPRSRRRGGCRVGGAARCPGAEVSDRWPRVGVALGVSGDADLCRPGDRPARPAPPARECRAAGVQGRGAPGRVE